MQVYFMPESAAMHAVPLLLSVERIVFLSVCLGLIVHAVFRKYEPTDFLSLTFLLGALPALPVSLIQVHPDASFFNVAVSGTIFYLTLLFSIIAYRLSPLHPFHRHPGPMMCKISKLWIVYIVSRGKLYLYLQRLHEKYGPIVRIGPNELSIVNADLLPSIMGANGMPKGQLWDGRRISGKQGAASKEARAMSLIGARDKRQHALVRRDWNRAFSPAAVKTYERLAIRRASQLVEALRIASLQATSESSNVDLSQWIHFFTFDLIGDMVFGGGIELMRDGDKDGLCGHMGSSLLLPALTEQIPWCVGILSYLPFVGRHMRALGKFAVQQAAKRIKEGFIIYMTNGIKIPFPVVVSSSVLAIVAGSDIGEALANTIYCLVSHPACYARLRAEVDEAFPLDEGEPSDVDKLTRMPYLNAVINESLRLYPSVPSCLQRGPTPGTGGHAIGPELYIPEGSAVFVPPYVLHRDPRYFTPEPEKFMPERWIPGEMTGSVLNRKAYIPFSTGPANCAGKPIALSSVRIAVAYLVQSFEIRFADNYDQSRYYHDLQDYFIMKNGPLPVVLTPRSQM